MIGISQNKTAILTDDFRIFTEITADVSLVIYNQLVKQLHLPTNELVFSVADKQKMWAEEVENAEEFDQLLLDRFELSAVVAPTKLFTFCLLRKWLGLGVDLNAIQVIHGKKQQIVYPACKFELNQVRNLIVELNAFDTVVMKQLKVKDLKQTQADFFALLNEKLEAKLFNTMVHFQSETKLKVNKNDFLALLFNADRNKALQNFIAKEIEKL